ncbi:MAG: hypothetical protein AB1521_17770, partial [Bacteroidota bacterium]
TLDQKTSGSTPDGAALLNPCNEINCKDFFYCKLSDFFMQHTINTTLQHKQSLWATSYFQIIFNNSIFKNIFLTIN